MPPLGRAGKVWHFHWGDGVTFTQTNHSWSSTYDLRTKRMCSKGAVFPHRNCKTVFKNGIMHVKAKRNKGYSENLLNIHLTKETCLL